MDQVRVVSAIRDSKTLWLRPDLGPSGASGANDELGRAEAATLCGSVGINRAKQSQFGNR